jgi:hypothetical protein
LLDAGDDDFQQVLPAGTFRSDGKSARDEFEPTTSTSINPHVKQDGGVEFEKPVLPEDDLVGAKAHGWPPVAR